jgi:hypothetical protein
VKAFAEAIDAERARQIAKFGDQKHPDGTGSLEQQKYVETARRWCEDSFGSGYGTWADILDEEVAEAKAERDPAKLRAELLQVAAVCAAWIYDIDQRPAPAQTTHRGPHPEHGGLETHQGTVEDCTGPDCYPGMYDECPCGAHYPNWEHTDSCDSEE